MKKLLFLFISFVAFCSCDNEEFDFTAPVEAQSEIAVDSFYVSFEEALAQAEKMLAGTTTTRASATKRKVANHHEYVANRSTRATGDDVEVRFHVINFEDNQGFALVSADSRTTPVYAYSETGNLDIEDATENTGFGDFMDAATEYYIAEAELTDPDNPLLPTDPNNQTLPITPVPTNPILQLPIVELDGERYYISGEDIELQNPGGVLVDVEWHQHWPYNYYCGYNYATGSDNGYCNATGCGPLAAAQIMSSFKYPASFGGYTLEWDSITSSRCFFELYPTISNPAKSAARLINLIGIEANAVYGKKTTTYINDMDEMFNSFGYSCMGPVTFNSSKIIESLNAYSPVYTRGERKEGTTLDVHAWIIDSYKQMKTITTYYHSYEPYFVAFTTTSMGDIYYHCNWGYASKSNAAFTLATNHNGWYLDVFRGYNITNKIIYNIRPNI